MSNKTDGDPTPGTATDALPLTTGQLVRMGVASALLTFLIDWSFESQKGTWHHVWYSILLGGSAFGVLFLFRALVNRR